MIENLTWGETDGVKQEVDSRDQVTKHVGFRKETDVGGRARVTRDELLIRLCLWRACGRVLRRIPQLS